MLRLRGLMAVAPLGEDPSAAYDRLFAEYRLLHDYFGRGTNEVMHRLRRIRAEVSASS